MDGEEGLRLRGLGLGARQLQGTPQVGPLRAQGKRRDSFRQGRLTRREVAFIDGMISHADDATAFFAD